MRLSPWSADAIGVPCPSCPAPRHSPCFSSTGVHRARAAMAQRRLRREKLVSSLMTRHRQRWRKRLKRR
jgi:hypothetical protein